MQNLRNRKRDTSSMKMSPGLVKVVQKIANYRMARFGTWTTALQSQIRAFKYLLRGSPNGTYNLCVYTYTRTQTDSETSGLHLKGGMEENLRSGRRWRRRWALLLVEIAKNGVAWGNVERVVEGLRRVDGWRRWNRAMAAISFER